MQARNRDRETCRALAPYPLSAGRGREDRHHRGESAGVNPVTLMDSGTYTFTLLNRFSTTANKACALSIVWAVGIR